MSIKLIAVDIDGTLLNSQRQVTPEVFQAIQDAKAAGVKVVIATGRPIPGVLPLLEELNLNQDGDYVITFNGGLVQETSTGNELIRGVSGRTSTKCLMENGRNRRTLTRPTFSP